MHRFRVPGVALAAIRNGAVLWQEAFGVRRVVPSLPVTEQTVFEVASLGKPVFAYLVLRLWEDGLLDLDVPLTEYVPEPCIPGEPRLSAVTARLVLSHRAGFPNWWTKDKPRALLCAPGERFTYSGEAYQYLQRAVERITGQTLQELARDRVFDPLGMDDSSYVWRESFNDVAADGHWIDGNVRNERPQRARAGLSLHTTLRDYVRFVGAMSGRSPSARSGLRAPTLAAMLTPYAEYQHGLHWGLGWALQPSEHGTGFWSCGGNFGYSSFVVATPHGGTGVVAMSNAANGIALFKVVIPRVAGGGQPGLMSCGEPSVVVQQR